MTEVENGLLAIVGDADGRQTLRNICIAYDETIVDRFGRAVLFEPTELGAFLAFRLRAKHGDVRILRTRAIDERRSAYRRAYDAARAYEGRSHKHTPYRKFAAGTDHPLPEEMAGRRLAVSTTDRAAETDPTDGRFGESTGGRSGEGATGRDDGDRLVDRRTD